MPGSDGTCASCVVIVSFDLGARSLLPELLWWETPDDVGGWPGDDPEDVAAVAADAVASGAVEGVEDK
jgi:hypothetical protein